MPYVLSKLRHDCGRGGCALRHRSRRNQLQQDVELRAQSAQLHAATVLLQGEHGPVQQPGAGGVHCRHRRSVEHEVPIVWPA
jgi:hypothetical protein